jgi:hypothetical protein
MAFKMLTTNTLEDLMSTLAKLYEKPSTSNKVFLMKHFFDMKMIKGGSVIDHLNEFNMITIQLNSFNVKFDEEVRDLLILCSLFERWNSLVMEVIKKISSSNTLKFDNVVGVILRKEICRKISGSTSTLGSVLNEESRGK